MVRQGIKIQLHGAARALWGDEKALPRRAQRPSFGQCRASGCFLWARSANETARAFHAALAAAPQEQDLGLGCHPRLPADDAFDCWAVTP